MDKNIVIALINSLIEKRINAIDLTEFRGTRGPRGFKGRQGESGKDFVFSENKDEIDQVIQAYIDSIKENLSLSFDDLSEDQKDSLKLKIDDLSDDDLQLIRGPRGQRGKSGKSINWDDVKSEVLDNLNKLYGEEKESFKLKFSDLTDDDKDDLRLKFEHLTDENILELRGERGPRGQRGARGAKGEQGEKGEKGDKGDRGSIGPRGLIGLTGLKGERGFSGKDGRDGRDAPAIVQVRVNKVSGKIRFVFVFSDGSEEETNLIELPSAQTFISQSVATSSGSGGAGALEFFSEGVSLGTFEKVDFLNANVQVDGTDSTKLNVDVKSCLPVLNEGITVSSCPKSIDFIGDSVQVLPEQVIANWATLSEVTDLATYGGDPDNVKVVISGQAEKLVKTFVAGEAIARLQPVRLSTSQEIFTSNKDTNYQEANVTGVAINSVGAGGDVQVQFFGILDDPSFSFLASEPVFLGSGSLQQNAPVASGEFITEVAQGLGAGSIFINPNSPVEIL